VLLIFLSELKKHLDRIWWNNLLLLLSPANQPPASNLVSSLML
jgi:hypothetical protein